MSSSVKKIVFMVFPAFTVLLFVAMAIIVFNISPPNLTRDTSAIGGIHPLSGVLSNLGIILWCFTSSLCLFTAVVLKHAHNKEHYYFFLFSGLLTTYLMIDDFFLFHEVMAKSIFGLGEKFIYIFLAASVFSYLLCFRKTILASNFSLLFLAFSCLSLSVVIDSMLVQWLSRLGEWHYFLEDGFKWMGIVFWFGYYFDISLKYVLNLVSSPVKQG